MGKADHLRRDVDDFIVTPEQQRLTDQRIDALKSWEEFFGYPRPHRRNDFFRWWIRLGLPPEEFTHEISERKLLAAIEEFCLLEQKAVGEKAHRQKIFPKGFDGIRQDLIDLAVRIETQHPQARTLTAREFFANNSDCELSAQRALSSIRKLENEGRLVLPKKEKRT